MVLATKVDINSDFVFSKISAEDVYCREVPNLQVGHAICSPLRNDKSPSLIFKIGTSGHMRHKDMAYPDDNRYSGGPVDFIMSRYGLSYDGALRKIAQDFCLLETNEKYKEITKQIIKPVQDPRRSAFIQVETRVWQQKDTDYWKQFGITKKEIRDEEIYPIKQCSVNRITVLHETSPEIAYCYRFPNGFKVYFPSREKKLKWVCNIPTNTVEGLDKIKDASQILITKSRKDRLVLSRYVPNVISVQNESRSAFKEELIQLLEGKDVIINFDSDLPGKTSSIKITREFGFRHINVPDGYLPKVKDFSDMYKDYGEKPIIEILKQKHLI